MQVAEPPGSPAQEPIGAVGDFVLRAMDFRPALEPAEQALLLEEAWRLGLGADYRHARGLCLTVGSNESSPDLDAVRAALSLIEAAVADGRPVPPVQYGFIPSPHHVDSFVELYHGDLKTFAEGVAS
jgi:hypothetical protein